MDKICRQCGEPKDLDRDFYRHPMMADGHLNKCKECVKKRVRIHRDTFIERIRAYDRERGRTDERVSRIRAYSRTPRGKEVHLKAAGKWAEQNRTKRAAQWAVSNALRDGKLKKGPCEVCGTTRKVEGHHEDYSSPLEVTWLCQKHHALTRRIEVSKKGKRCVYTIFPTNSKL